MFAATAGAGPPSAPPPPTTVEIAAAEAEQDAGGGVEEGNEWRPRPRSAIAGGGAGQGSGEEIGSLSPLSGTVAGLVEFRGGPDPALSRFPRWVQTHGGAGGPEVRGPLEGGGVW
ncbi:unnamed protein product [Arctogadus glacialis]